MAWLRFKHCFEPESTVRLFMQFCTKSEYGRQLKLCQNCSKNSWPFQVHHCRSVDHFAWRCRWRPRLDTSWRGRVDNRPQLQVQLFSAIFCIWKYEVERSDEPLWWTSLYLHIVATIISDRVTGQLNKTFQGEKKHEIRVDYRQCGHLCHVPLVVIKLDNSLATVFKSKCNQRNQEFHQTNFVFGNLAIMIVLCISFVNKVHCYNILYAS